MIAAYLRVSTYDQNNASQRAAIEEWLRRHGHAENGVRWYEDAATGANLDRPGFEAMQADILAGKITTVLVYKMDRLSRDLRDGVNLICDWIERKIRIVAVSQGFDFAGALGKLNIALVFALADIDRENIRERQAAGIAAAKSRGVYRGGKSGAISRFRKTPGYDKKIDVIREAASLKAKGNSYAHISRHLGIAHRTLKKYLRMAADEGLIAAADI